jgi:endonuclease YncB( thermonuclease family)
MAKAIKILDSGLKIGLSLLGRHGDGRGSPAQQIHDGDTIIVETAGNLSVRFLGIDAPEVSFTLPGSNQFRSIASSDWEEFLNDPFVDAPDAFLTELGNDLRQHLESVTGQGCASNHAHHAEQSHRYLEQLVIQDMQILSRDKNTFHFFMAFAHEIMDGYGRLLCFINRNQENPTIPEPRPHSYNERMLEAGMASPYFIWPNVNPFRRQSTLRQAVPRAGDIDEIAIGTDGLGPARQWVKEARQRGVGIFESNNPLMLQPFELRFLSRREAPSRWVIDLSDSGTRTLLQPVNYHSIGDIEDRLFVPEEYVPLFVEEGWQRQ